MMVVICQHIWKRLWPVGTTTNEPHEYYCTRCGARH